MTRAEVSRAYRLRHPERQRIFRRISNLKARGGDPETLRVYQELLATIELSKCTVCGRGYRECDRKDSECREGNLNV